MLILSAPHGIGLIGHVGFAGGASGGTTAGVNTTGANLIVLTAAGAAGSAIPVSDSLSNTWTLVINPQNAANQTAVYYCSNPTVGAGHTFTCGGSVSSIQVTAWSNCAPSGALDQSVSFGSFNPGVITPADPKALVISSYVEALTTGSSTIGIGSGFTISDVAPFTNSVNYGSAQAYYILPGAPAAISPTWSEANGGSLDVQTTLVSFNPA